MKFRIPKLINLERWIKHKGTREWLEALIFALIFATIFRTWLYSPFRVPTGSMIPTIQVGDQIFADMHYYGFVVPFTDAKIPANGKVKRGDIIIFPSPENPKICDNSFYSAFDTIRSLFLGFFNNQYVPACVDFIKRAVAIGGDRIKILGEDVFINEKKESGYTPYFNSNIYPDKIFHEEIVPEDSIFAMGDNRRNSHDGRYWNKDPNNNWGYVKEKKVRAKAMLIYLSIEPGLPIWKGLRTDRIFQILK